jgi:hypothetical protein
MHRVDRSLLKTVPRGPGVYFMYSENGLLVYVGKAKSLRKRLASYWRCTADDSRKLERMKRAVTTIEWRETESEKAALLLENSLLRDHRPLFNVMNTKPENYPYVVLREGRVAEGRVLCRLFTAHTPEGVGADDTLYGAFRARRLARQAADTIFELEKERRLRSAPEGETRLNPLRRGWILLTVEELSQLKSFLAGTRSKYLAELYGKLWDVDAFEDPLLAKKLDTDFRVLRAFFEYGPRRNRLMKLRLGLDSSLIEQDKLDDHIVELSFLGQENPQDDEKLQSLKGL